MILDRCVQVSLCFDLLLVCICLLHCNSNVSFRVPLSLLICRVSIISALSLQLLKYIDCWVNV